MTYWLLSNTVSVTTVTQTLCCIISECDPIITQDQIITWENLHFGRYVCLSCICWCPGPRFNMNMLSYQYRKSHCGDKTVVRSFYLHNGISYTGKMSFLYWTGAVVPLAQGIYIHHNEMADRYMWGVTLLHNFKFDWSCFLELKWLFRCGHIYSIFHEIVCVFSEKMLIIKHTDWYIGCVCLCGVRMCVCNFFKNIESYTNMLSVYFSFSVTARGYSQWDTSLRTVDTTGTTTLVSYLQVTVTHLKNGHPHL